MALQPGERGPEVSNLQTDAGEIFHAVRCGFARAFEVLAPLSQVEGAAGASAVDGWAAAKETFPDSILDEVYAHI